jgi:DNA invertase Pin-like site-specific DNA recombinase
LREAWRRASHPRAAKAHALRSCTDSRFSATGINATWADDGPSHLVCCARTSSAANVGADKDSDKRQREAIRRFAKASGYEIVDEFYDAAVSGADAIGDRPSFRALLDRIETNGVRIVLIEDATRLARDLMVQETGVLSLIALGVTVLTASGDNLTETQDPMKKFMRQLAGAFAELEKARIVDKLRHARERIRQTGRKCEGRKSHAELRPDVVRAAKRLHRANPVTGKHRSLRKIAAELAKMGYVNDSGKPFAAASIKAMVEGPAPTKGRGMIA